MSESINNTNVYWYIWRMEYYKAIITINYGFMQYVDDWKILWGAKVATHQGLYTVCPHICEVQE